MGAIYDILQRTGDYITSFGIGITTKPTGTVGQLQVNAATTIDNTANVQITANATGAKALVLQRFSSGSSAAIFDCQAQDSTSFFSVSSGGTVAVSRTLVFSRQAFATATGTIATASGMIVAATGTATTAQNLTLPAASTSGRTLFFIKDEGGLAGTNNVTITAAGADTIDGAATKLINVNYGSLTIYGNGSNAWFII